MASPKKLQGLVAATITPMTSDGKINCSVIEQYVDYLVINQGVKNVFVNGTTGEGLSLSTEERKQLAEAWVTKGKDKLDHVIIHVGALSLPETKELVRERIFPFLCLSIKYDCLLSLPLSDALVAFLQEVASEAPDTPFYYYHIPPLTGVKIRVEELLDGITEQIPTFQGVKFSDTDLLDFAQCVNKYQEKFVLLYGVDEQLLSALVVGASGAVGSTYNYLGKQYNVMLEAFAKQDLELAQQCQVHPLHLLIIFSFVCLGFGVAQIKEVMTFASGIVMGPPRLPLLRASQDFIEKANAKLKSV
uniref:N-acetylneuraminate lyase n=1 Tax=Pelodiscus sinensis TaxID=13735 RepID=K7FG69_PELSI